MTKGMILSMIIFLLFTAIGSQLEAYKVIVEPSYWAFYGFCFGLLAAFVQEKC